MLSMAGDRHILLWRAVSFVWVYLVISSQLKSTDAQEKNCSFITLTTDTSSLHVNVNESSVSIKGHFLITVNGTPTSFSDFKETILQLPAGSLHEVNLHFKGTDDMKHDCNETRIIWTKPGAPGPVTTNIPLGDYVKEPNKRMFQITFIPSPHLVHYYKLIIGNVDACKYNTTATSFKCGPLMPYTKYNYTLTAYNGNNDASTETKGWFKTNATASSSVTNVTIANSTYYATIKWNSPIYPNGIISHYSISVKAQDEDYNCIFCFRCLAPVTKVTNDYCYPGNTPYSGRCSTVEEGGSCDSFSVQVGELLPYTNYTVSISAVNEKGPGHGSSETFTTEIGVATNVSNVRLSSVRNDSSGLIDMTVTWTRGAKAGPTTYYVQLDEESNYTPDKLNSKVCTGQNDTRCVINNVKAFWNYQAGVIAKTEKGESQWVYSEINRTVENNPGVVRNLTVVQDNKVAQRFTVKFHCPEESEHNGTIKQYVVNSILLGSNGEQESVTSNVFNSTNCTMSVQLTGLKVERDYKVAVQAINNYNGTFSDYKEFTVESRAPTLTDGGKTPSAIIKKNAESRNERTKIAMTLCAECLLNSSQGEVKNVGLLVCVKGANNPCNSTETNYSKFDTWAKSKKTFFVQSYRTTPDDWKENLSRYKEMNYTIGDDSNCATELENKFCNGPLPEGRTVIVSAMVCTSRGCDSVQTDDINLPSYQEKSHAGAIAGAVVSTMIGTLLVCFVILLIFRKKPALLLCIKPKVELEPEISHNRPIKLRDFEEYVKKLHKDSNLLFQDEFEQIRNLCMTFKTSCNEAQREANRIKNRYVDILPYDHSRVRLDVQPEDDETNDFINANYIPGMNSVREYIATQGPMHCTVPDFWRMAWEQKCHIIVMLSDLQEGGKLKVDQYWPENLNEPVHFENVIVEVTNFSQLNKYIIRNFRITKGDEVRKVIQFFLPGWWDFSANLNFEDVIEFITMVRQAVTPETAGPIIVHCSAGVGRTGTMIALDYFIQYVDKGSLNDEMDIFHYVLQMRKNRTRMVQAESQYIFIFDALREVIKKKIAIEEGRLSQIHEGSPGEEVKPTANDTTCVTIQVVDKKCAYNNAAFEPEDAKKVASETTEKSSSEP